MISVREVQSVTSQANILEGLETVTNSSIDTLGVLSFKGLYPQNQEELKKL